MRIVDVEDSIRVQMDKTDSHAYADMRDEELCFWIDEAVKAFIKLRYGANNNVHKPFESSEKRVDDLRTMIESFISTSFSVDPFYEANRLVLPDNYWILSNIAVIAKYKNCADRQYKQKFIRHDQISVALQDPFHRPNETKVLYSVENNEIIIFKDTDVTLSKVKLVYIRKPKSCLDTILGRPGNAYSSLNDELELPDLVHNEVTKLAVSMILESIESERYKTIGNEFRDVE